MVRITFIFDMMDFDDLSRLTKQQNLDTRIELYASTKPNPPHVYKIFVTTPYEQRNIIIRSAYAKCNELLDAKNTAFEILIYHQTTYEDWEMNELHMLNRLPESIAKLKAVGNHEPIKVTMRIIAHASKNGLYHYYSADSNRKGEIPIHAFVDMLNKFLPESLKNGLPEVNFRIVLIVCSAGTGHGTASGGLDESYAYQLAERLQYEIPQLIYEVKAYPMLIFDTNDAFGSDVSLYEWRMGALSAFTGIDAEKEGLRSKETGVHLHPGLYFGTSRAPSASGDLELPFALEVRRKRHIAQKQVIEIGDPIYFAKHAALIKNLITPPNCVSDGMLENAIAAQLSGTEKTKAAQICNALRIIGADILIVLS